MIKITHVITNLAVGGAEIALEDLLDRLSPEKFENSVISLMEIDTVGERIKRKGIKVHSLGMRRGAPGPIAFMELIRLLKQESPDIIQTWLYHADLACMAAGFFIRKTPLFWNIRCVDMLGGKKMKPLYPVMKLLAWFSGRPEGIIVNSEAGRSFHEKFGYDPEKLTVIQNGVDVEKFQPSAKARQNMRHSLGLDDSTLLIGLVGRYDSVKGFDVLLSAVSLLKQNYPKIKVALVGQGTGNENSELGMMIANQKLSDTVIRMGMMEDMPLVYPAFDLFVSASLSEGFSNVTAEAMACGLPCVATDVGDSAQIIGDTGFLSPPNDPQKLAENIKKLLHMSTADRADLGRRARIRISENFTPQSALAKYEKLYTQAVSQVVSK